MRRRNEGKRESIAKTLMEDIGGSPAAEKRVMVQKMRAAGGFAKKAGEDMGSDDDDDQELEEGEEFCPICHRKNWPGALDTCRHYLGLVWDGSFTGTNMDYNRFCDARSRYAGAVEAIPESRALADRRIRDVAKRVGLDPRFVKYGNTDNYSASNALVALFGGRSGSLTTIDGMLGGSGYSLYHRDPKIIRNLASSYSKLTKIARQVATNTNKG